MKFSSGILFCETLGKYMQNPGEEREFGAHCSKKEPILSIKLNNLRQCY
jgi:hypothetical protein